MYLNGILHLGRESKLRVICFSRCTYDDNFLSPQSRACGGLASRLYNAFIIFSPSDAGQFSVVVRTLGAELALQRTTRFALFRARNGPRAESELFQCR